MFFSSCDSEATCSIVTSDSLDMIFIQRPTTPGMAALLILIWGRKIKGAGESFVIAVNDYLFVLFIQLTWQRCR